MIRVIASVRKMAEITRNLVICVLAVCFGAQFQFYSMTMCSNVGAVWKNWFNESVVERYGSKLTSTGASWVYGVITGCLQIGAILSSLSTKIAAERLGRRRTLMLTGALMAVGAILCGASKPAESLELLGVGRFVIGLGFGVGLGVASMFVSELAPPTRRGAIGTFQQIFIGLGMTAGFAVTLPQLLGTASWWPVAAALPAVPAVIQVIVVCWAHDSPKYLLLTKKNRDAALSSLRFYKGPVEAERALAELEAERDRAANGGETITFFQVLRRSIYRKALLVSFLLMFSIQFTGITPILAFSRTIFEDSGLDDESSQYATVGLGLINLFCPFIVLVLIDRFGRRVLLLSGLGVAFVSLLATTILIAISYRTHRSVLLAISVAFIYIFQIGYALTSSVAWIIPSELFPQNVRSYAIGVCTFSFFFWQLVTVLAYLPFKDAVGVPVSMSPFLVATVLCFALFFVYVPETRGVSPEQFLLERCKNLSVKIRKISRAIIRSISGRRSVEAGKKSEAKEEAPIAYMKV